MLIPLVLCYLNNAWETIKLSSPRHRHQLFKPSNSISTSVVKTKGKNPFSEQVFKVKFRANIETAGAVLYENFTDNYSDFVCITGQSEPRYWRWDLTTAHESFTLLHRRISYNNNNYNNNNNNQRAPCCATPRSALKHQSRSIRYNVLRLGCRQVKSKLSLCYCIIFSFFLSFFTSYPSETYKTHCRRRPDDDSCSCAFARDLCTHGT